MEEINFDEKELTEKLKVCYNFFFNFRTEIAFQKLQKIEFSEIF